MTSKTCRRNASDLLSTALWSKVFIQLPPGPPSAVEDNQLYCKQEELLRLRLVCRVFRAVYDAQPCFASHLLLPASFSTASIPSLLQWLQTHASIVQSVTTRCGCPCLDAALTGLACHNIALIAAYLRACGGSSLLSETQTLTQLELGFAPGQTISLVPLLTLPSLKALALFGEEGVFTTDKVPQYLTGLSLTE